MLFNSFVFLPITYAVFRTLRTAQSRYIWLTTAEGTVFGDAVHFTNRGAAIVADAFASGVVAALPQGPCVRNDTAALSRRSER